MKPLSFKKILIIYSLVCLISYSSTLIPPSFFWPSLFIAYTIPLFLILTPVMLVSTLVINFRYSFISFLLLLMGVPFYQSIVNFSGNREDLERKTESAFSVLSYNVKFFRQPNDYSIFSSETIEWVVNDMSDIKCIQEFSTNPSWKFLDTEKLIQEKGYNAFVYKATVPDADHNPGMAIFSKFEIVNSGIIWEGISSSNAGIYADIKYGADTIRIYNIHLTSLRLQIGHSYKTILKVLKNFKETVSMHENQVDKLISNTNECPYPFIICGDLNEPPFSYNYLHLIRYYNDSFYEAVSGFNQTFTKIPIRIDYQFYGFEIAPLDFSVNSNITHSDHFPLIGTYHVRGY